MLEHIMSLLLFVLLQVRSESNNASGNKWLTLWW